MFDNIEIKAGRKALGIIRDGGLAPDKVKYLAGASGGPKWLVLSGIDRVLPEFFRYRKEPLLAIGSSIGAWRIAALAQKNPLDAISLFEESYIRQHYHGNPTPSEVTSESYKIIHAFISDKGIDDALHHPYLRVHILAVKSKRSGESENKIILGLNLAAAAAANLVSRQFLGLFFDRVLFNDPRAQNAFPCLTGFNTGHVPLNKNNFIDAIMASGSIPLVMKGIRDIDSAPQGVYRDGGVVDYHLDIPFADKDDDIVLYPHFFNKIIPGWFDKGIPWRSPRMENTDNVLLISPSEKFIASLPYGKIPDRKDFNVFMGNDKERIRYWEKVVKLNKILGEEFMEAFQSGNIRDQIKPI